MKIPSRCLAVAALLLLGPPSVRACPLCASETGERVRAGIFNADFGYNLFATVLPFSAFLAIVASIHYGWPWAKARPGPITPLDADVTKRP